MRYTVTFLFLVIVSFSFAQQKREKVPSYFGFQVKPIFPGVFIGTTKKTISLDGFDTKIKQSIGYSFGGVVRAGITKLIAIETGINITQRKFQIESSVPDSNAFVTAPLRYVTYDIPISALFYIRLSDKFYMNASIGAAIAYNPTVAGVFRTVKVDNKPGVHEFAQIAFGRKVLGEAVSNIGFEFRHDKAGIFYVGAAARVPFTPLFYLRSEYKYEGYKVQTDAENFGKIDGSYISLEFKYFFPLIKSKGSPIRTPIE